MFSSRRLKALLNCGCSLAVRLSFILVIYNRTMAAGSQYFDEAHDADGKLKRTCILQCSIAEYRNVLCLLPNRLTTIRSLITQSSNPVVMGDNTRI